MPLFLFLLIPVLGIALLLMPKRIVTQQQAGRAVGVGDRTIRNWISEGLITGYRLPSGRAIRVDLEEIEQMIKVIPTVRTGKLPFGPKAKIIDLSHAIEALPPRPEADTQADDQNQAEALAGGDR